MKTIFLAISILTLVVGISFAGGDAEQGEPQVALVTDVGGIDDKSFNQGTWNGIQRFKKDFNVNGVTFLQSESDADYIPNLSTVADDGYKLIVAPGFLFVDAIADVSKNYPDTHFLVIDTVVSDRTNVVSAIFAEEQGSFLVGVAAALKAQAGGFSKVGFIGGLDFDIIQHFESGFERGVEAVDPSIQVLIEYVGSFSDPQKGQTIASKLYDQGAGVVFHAAGSTGNGVIKEAKDRALQGKEAWVIGVDRDQYEEGIYKGSQSVVLTSMVKRVDVAAYDIAKMEMEGNFPGGTVMRFDLANEGVGIPEKNPNLSSKMVKTIKSYQTQIVDGTISVPEFPKRIQ